MKNQQLKAIVLISLLSFTSLAGATAGAGKQKPPETNSTQVNTQPGDSTGPSFWSWLSSYFYF